MDSVAEDGRQGPAGALSVTSMLAERWGLGRAGVSDGRAGGRTPGITSWNRPLHSWETGPAGRTPVSHSGRAGPSSSRPGDRPPARSAVEAQMCARRDAHARRSDLAGVRQGPATRPARANQPERRGASGAQSRKRPRGAPGHPSRLPALGRPVSACSTPVASGTAAGQACPGCEGRPPLAPV